MSSAREIIAGDLDRYCVSPLARADSVIAALRAAGHRILGPGEEADVRRVVEIANRNEWSEEGDRLARALATDTGDEK